MTNRVGFKGHPQSMRDEASKLARRGVHFRDIAERLNVTPNTIQKWCWTALESLPETEIDGEWYGPHNLPLHVTGGEAEADPVGGLAWEFAGGEVRAGADGERIREAVESD